MIFPGSVPRLVVGVLIGPLFASTACAQAIGPDVSPDRAVRTELPNPPALLPNDSVLRASVLPEPGAGGTAPDVATSAPSSQPDAEPALLKKYNFLQEAGLCTPGQVQIEQDFGLLHRLKSQPAYTVFSGLTQVAYSLSDRFMVTGILATYSYTDAGGPEGLRYDTSGFQLYYALTDPDKDGLGVSLFQSALLGPEVLSLDTRLLVLKQLGPWDITYNLRFANDFTGLDGGGVSTTGTLGHALGVSYQFDDGLPKPISHFVLGAELTVDSSFNEWRHYTETTVYLGPVFGLTFCHNWSLSLTTMFQATDNDVPRYLVASALIYSF
jgi:hypothetical protein